MTFWQKNKWKIIVPVLIVLVLAAAFVFGDQNIPAQPTPAEQPTVSAPAESTGEPAEPTPEEPTPEEPADVPTAEEPEQADESAAKETEQPDEPAAEEPPAAAPQRRHPHRLRRLDRLPRPRREVFRQPRRQDHERRPHSVCCGDDRRQSCFHAALAQRKNQPAARPKQRGRAEPIAARAQTMLSS